MFITRGEQLSECPNFYSSPAFNHLTPTVAILVQLQSILCQTGLSRNL